jgi:hypothetical protein
MKKLDPSGAGKKPAMKLPMRPGAPKLGAQKLPGKARPAQAPKAFALKQLKKFKAEARKRNK